MTVTEIRSKSHFDSLLSSNKVVILDIYGTWCGPCKMFEPQFERLSNKYDHPDILFAKEDSALGLRVVHGLPSILIFIEGRQVHDILGGDGAELERVLSQILGLEDKSRARSRYPAFV